MVSREMERQMAGLRNASNKAKIARRVVEVLEYFDEDHPEATVMDIVRRYDRPQSSTSELLSSLVELGLLHKDPYARSYRPTARAALLGATSQHGAVRDGRLVQFLDRLVAQTGLPVLLMTKTGLEVQIVNARQGASPRLRRTAAFRGGMREALARNVAGWLLLSTVEQARREPMLRRLNAEAAESDKFNPTELARQIGEIGAAGIVCGPAGFRTGESMVAMLLPCRSGEDVLVAAIVMDKPGQSEALTQYLADAVEKWLADPEISDVGTFASAA
jgi:DNA-binding IclR family transcriptional regulator